jgi:hypothetical protein
MTTKTLYFADCTRGELRWTQHFTGRAGCSRTYISRDDDSGHGAGIHLEMPVEVAQAWDVALRAVKANRTLSAEQATEHIEAALDAVSAREVRS